MRRSVLVGITLLVVLAGCSTGYGGPVETTPESPDQTPRGTPGVDGTGPDGRDGPDGTDGTRVVSPPDPPTDRLGWEDGYWANETLGVTPADGLNETELQQVIARTMARVERIRQLEFERSVPVEVISRSTYRERSRNRTNYTRGFRLFDNAKFEALFLVGEDRDSIAVQEANRGTAVQGSYSVRNDTIVIVSESDNPKIRDETTLGHELVHALQDQRFNLSTFHAETRDGYDGQRGLIEGDAQYVQQAYRRVCGAGRWQCISLPPDDGNGGSSGGDLHLGVFLLSFSPYSDGPGFIKYYRNRGGWERINDIYGLVPMSSEQIIDPPKYPEDRPANLSIEDATRDGWQRLRPGPVRPNEVRADHARLGQAALSTMFVYTLYDNYNDSRVVAPSDFLNREGQNRLNRSDPFNYGLSYTTGWEGDRMHVYRHPNRTNETAYVWKLTWESPAEAEEFAGGYRDLLAHWGGRRVADREWVVESSPFADAFYLAVNGDTVVIVNAPDREALGDVHAEAG